MLDAAVTATGTAAYLIVWHIYSGSMQEKKRTPWSETNMIFSKH